MLVTIDGVLISINNTNFYSFILEFILLAYRLLLIIIMLDLNRLDPDWSFAQRHGKSCSPGILRRPMIDMSSGSQQIVQDSNLCPCCLNVIDKQPVPLCQNSKQLQFLGFGFPLYFIFMKYSIILLLVQVASYNAISILWATKSSEDICQSSGAFHILPGQFKGICTSWLILLVRTEVELSDNQIVLRLSSFFIQMFALMYIRDVINKTNRYYKERTTLISQFSIIIRNIPKQFGTAKKIKNFIEHGLMKSIKVKQIIFLYELVSFQKLNEEKTQLINEKKLCLHNGNSNKIGEIDLQLEKIDEQIRLECLSQLKKQQQDQILCEKVIAILDSNINRKVVKSHFQKIRQDDNKLRQIFGEGSQKIEIHDAPEPKQIKWQNIHISNHKKIIRLVIGWGLTVLFISAVTGVFYLVLRQKNIMIIQAFEGVNHLTNPEEAHRLQKISLVITILSQLFIIFFNKYVLAYVLHIFTDIQQHSSGTTEQFSLGLKYTFGVFFTTAIMTLLVEAISFHNIYSEHFGVAEEQSIAVFFNAFLVPIVWLVNLEAVVHRIKTYFKKGSKDMTQRQANMLMQDPKFLIGKYYAEIIQSIWFVYMYASLIPIGAPILVLGFAEGYWVSKFNLLRQQSISENVDGQLNVRFLKLLDATLMLRGIGDLIFDTSIRDGASWQPILCIILGAIYLILPMNSILEFFHAEKFKVEEKLYQNVKQVFKMNYRAYDLLSKQEKIQLNVNKTRRFSQHLGRSKSNLCFDSQIIQM